jgi:hypothetical protein
MNQMIVGGPEWFSAGIGSSERYDVDTKAAQPAARAQLYLMLQQLLADRFALKAHAEQKELPVYELTIAKAGPKLTKEPRDRDCSVGCGVGRLDGLYDIKTSNFWMPFPDSKDPGSVPAIFDMLQNQFGLRPKAGKDPVSVLIIDHADKIPTGN